MNSILRRSKKSHLKSKLKKRNKKVMLNPALNNLTWIDYKNVEFLKKNFINIHGKIMPARSTRVTAAQQRQIRTAIIRARKMALLSNSNPRIINFKHNS